LNDACDALIEHLWANERTVLTDKQLDLGVLWGNDQAARADDVLRYFVKHICCRIAEYGAHPAGLALTRGEATS
jgi:hypothetical protein